MPSRLLRISRRASPDASSPIGDAIKCAEADFRLVGTMQREAAMSEHARKVLEARGNPDIKDDRMLNKMRTKPRISVTVDSTTSACLLGTTSLIKDDVYDAAGKFLGEIDEIVLDVHTGCVRYAVLALGGYLGFGQKRFAVPWRALTPDADYRRCIVDVTLMQLMAVPVPQDDPWLQRTGPTWSNPRGTS
jgi:hypothetical protein